MGNTMVRDSNADTVSVEDPLVRASKADLVVPIPGGATSIRRLGIIESRENAGTFNKVVSLEAGQAVTVLSVRGALVRNGNANFVSIEDPIFRAGEANLVVPIPSSTSGVGRLSIVGFSEDASSFDEVVSLETGKTVTVLGMSGALIRDSNADTVSIEDPLVRASKADLVEPVPGSASSVSGLGVVEGREKALSTGEVVTLVASGTVTVFGAFFTLVSNGNAGTGGTLEPVF